jgi:hypothetical protein
MSLGYSLKQVLAKISMFHPELIGVSMTSLFHQSVYDIMQTIKQHFPNISLVAGGPHISTCEHRCWRNARRLIMASPLRAMKPLLNYPGKIAGTDQRRALSDIVA